MDQKQNELRAWTLYVATKNGFDPYECDDFGNLYAKALDFLVSQAEEDGSLVFEEADEASSKEVTHWVEDFNWCYKSWGEMGAERCYDGSFERVSRFSDGIYGTVLYYVNKNEVVVAVYAELEKLGLKESI